MMKRNQKNGEITVSALSSSKTFANYKELNSFVESMANAFSPLAYAAKQKRDALDAGVTPHPSDPPDPPSPTPFDEQCAVLDEKEEDAETQYVELKEASHSQLDKLRAEAARRFARARGNSAKVSNAQIWLESARAEHRNLEFAFRKAERKLQRSRARANLLRQARDRWRQEQQIRVVFEGQAVTLAEFEELRRNEIK